MRLEMAGEVVGGRLLTVYRPMQEGRYAERVEDGPDSADMEEERGFARHRNVQGHHTTQ